MRGTHVRLRVAALHVCAGMSATQTNPRRHKGPFAGSDAEGLELR